MAIQARIHSIEKGNTKLTVPKFIVADDSGNPEDIIDPLEEKVEDPKPTTKRAPAKPKPDPKPSRPVGRPSKSQIEREVSEELEAMMKMMAMLWSIRDPECGPVLNKQAKDIADSLTDILAKNPKLLQRFKDMSGFGDYGKLLFAVLPVIKAVSNHHITPALKKVENGSAKAT